MAKPEPSLASSEDIVRAYALGLGRSPESERVVDDFRQCRLAFILGVFFHGPEFAGSVRAAISEEVRPSGALYDELPSQELKEWAAERLSLTATGVEAVLRSIDWLPLYHALFSDAAFRQDPDIGGSPFSPGEWAALERMASEPEAYGARAVIEDIGPAAVKGWAVNPHATEIPLTVEAWIDGSFAGATLADQFRRDLQDAFGGSGRYGFRLEFAPGERLAQGGRLELRLPGGRRVAETPLSPVTSTTDLDGLRAELSSLKAAIERLDATTSHLDAEQGAPLAGYSGYRDRYRRSPPLRGDRRHDPVAVLIDATGVPIVALSDAIESVFQQTTTGWSLIVHGLDAASRLLVEDLWRRRKLSGALDVDASLKVSATLLDALSSSDQDVVLMDGWTVLEPDAVDRMAAALGQGAGAVFSDEDALVEGSLGPLEDRERTSPAFKPGLDPDLLFQTPYVGRCLAFSRECLAEMPPRAEAGSLAGADVVLRLAARGRTRLVRHLPLVLFSRRTGGEPSEDLWVRCVASALAGRPGVRVESHSDELGGGLPKASRVRWPAAGTATVIIPTRDRLDLLKPCVDSILATTQNGRVSLDLLIVDHECRDRDALSFLADLQSRGVARVQRIETAFNWALLNNMAASTATSEVLVFLNDDTIAMHEGWLDELCAQSMRPEVGAVGARLLYQDGTIQHAGLLARNRLTNFLVHESVGLPGDSPGYLGRNRLVRQAAAVTGACMAVRRQVFEALGGFDAVQYPIEANDVDFCFRVREHGLRVLYDPHATLYHLESKTRGFSRSGDAKAIADEAALRIWSRWGEAASAWDGYPAVFDRLAPPFTRLRPPRLVPIDLGEAAHVKANQPPSPAPAPWRAAVHAVVHAVKVSVGIATP